MYLWRRHYYRIIQIILGSVSVIKKKEILYLYSETGSLRIVLLPSKLFAQFLFCNRRGADKQIPRLPLVHDPPFIPKLPQANPPQLQSPTTSESPLMLLMFPELSLYSFAKAPCFLGLSLIYFSDTPPLSGLAMHLADTHDIVQKRTWIMYLGTGKRGHFERGLFTGGISRISKISRFSRIPRKGLDSPLFSTVWRFSRNSRISKFSRISRKWTSLKRPLFRKIPFSEPEYPKWKQIQKIIRKIHPKNYRYRNYSGVHPKN